jgi:hypothetical protein
MCHDECGRSTELNCKIPVGDRIEGILADSIKPQLLRYHFAVDRITCSRQCRRSQWQLVHTLPAIGQALNIPFQHFKISHEMVTEYDGLRDLQVRETWHHRVNVRCSQIEHRTLKCMDEIYNAVDRGPQIEAHVGCHLIVARTRGVQALAGISNKSDKTFLDIKVHVFKFQLPGKLVKPYFVQNLT